MDHFHYHDGALFCENVPIDQLATRYGTPLYVYSRATLERHWHAFNDALNGHEHLVCYAVKANSNLAILNVLARLGSGFDIVSGGELERVLRAGGKPEKIVFSGVGKRDEEIQMGIDHGIQCFNIESEQELMRLSELAAASNRVARVSFRINPDVDPKTHPYISTGLQENKFGIPFERAEQIYQLATQLSHIDVIGIDCHIGSQLTELAPFIDALKRLLLLIQKLQVHGITIGHLDLGGGLGVRYRDETPPLPAEWVNALYAHLEDFEGKVVIEPGRAIAANAGILVTRTNYIKHTQNKAFAIVDAAMNDLIRPSLYSAWQDIIRVEQHSNAPERVYDVVGAICETGDFLGKERKLRLAQHDLLAIRSSGAYAFAMSSNYNSRCRAAEVMVDGDTHHCVRARETIEDLLHGESLLP